MMDTFKGSDDNFFEVGNVDHEQSVDAILLAVGAKAFNI